MDHPEPPSQTDSTLDDPSSQQQTQAAQVKFIRENPEATYKEIARLTEALRQANTTPTLSA